MTARYDSASDRIVVELNNGIMFSAPRSHVPELNGASPSEIAAIDVTGDALLWKTGAGVLVWQLLTGAFSGRRWMSELGRCGGMASTPKKRAAARKNGRKGGRPRKKAA